MCVRVRVLAAPVDSHPSLYLLPFRLRAASEKDQHSSIRHCRFILLRTLSSFCVIFFLFQNLLSPPTNELKYPCADYTTRDVTRARKSPPSPSFASTVGPVLFTRESTRLCLGGFVSLLGLARRRPQGGRHTSFELEDFPPLTSFTFYTKGGFAFISSCVGCSLL